MTSLLDMLKETDLQVGFTDLFTSISQREILPRESLQKRVLLCLYGLGTNTGLKRLVNADPGTTHPSGLYHSRTGCRTLMATVKRGGFPRTANRFGGTLGTSWGLTHHESRTPSRANACLVDYQAQISLAQAWGGGEVASADGLRFVVPLKTLNAGPK